MNARIEAAGVAMARKAVAAAPPRVLAAVQALADAEHIPWDLMDPQQQYTFCADAAAALAAADAVMFSDEAVERAARAMLDVIYDDKTLEVDDEDRGIIRAVIAALKGEPGLPAEPLVC